MSCFGQQPAGAVRTMMCTTLVACSITCGDQVVSFCASHNWNLEAHCCCCVYCICCRPLHQSVDAAHKQHLNMFAAYVVRSMMCTTLVTCSITRGDQFVSFCASHDWNLEAHCCCVCCICCQTLHQSLDAAQSNTLNPG